MNHKKESTQSWRSRGKLLQFSHLLIVILLFLRILETPLIVPPKRGKFAVPLLKRLFAGSRLFADSRLFAGCWWMSAKYCNWSMWKTGAGEDCWWPGCTPLLNILAGLATIAAADTATMCSLSTFQTLRIFCYWTTHQCHSYQEWWTSSDRRQYWWWSNTSSSEVSWNIRGGIDQDGCPSSNCGNLL